MYSIFGNQGGNRGAFGANTQLDYDFETKVETAEPEKKFLAIFPTKVDTAGIARPSRRMRDLREFGGISAVFATEIEMSQDRKKLSQLRYRG